MIGDFFLVFILENTKASPYLIIKLLNEGLNAT